MRNAREQARFRRSEDPLRKEEPCVFPVPSTPFAGKDRKANGTCLDRRTALLGGVAAAAAVAFPAAARAVRPAKGRMQDLTHTFTAGFPVFTFDAPRRRTLVTIPAGGFYAQEWTFGEHSGTHMDAPGHFVSGGRLSPEITPQELIVPVIVIDIAARAASTPTRWSRLTT